MRLFRSSKSRVAIIKIEGVIADGDSVGAGRAKIVAALKQAERRKARAVVLRLNSPGGSVAACQEIYNSVVRLKEKGIPVIASMGDVAASGGVYISMAANEIIANPGSVTGSIGVIIRSSDLSDLYDKVGVSAKVVKSGPHKDMLATYRSFTSDEEALLQGVIDDTHRQFIDVIVTCRKKTEADVEKLADGRILTGRQAFQAGLVDMLGDLEMAVERASSRAGISGKPQIIVIEPRKNLWQKLLNPLIGYGQRASPVGRLSGIPLWLMPTY